MKKLLILAMLVATVVAMAGYDADMKALYGSQTAVTWQNENDAALAEATSPDALAAFVKDADAAAALLAEVKSAYATCPMKAMQIAAVSQFVMQDDCWCRKVFLFWTQTHDDQRRIWTKALLTAAKRATDPYVQVFMLDQLRWCGYPCQAPEVSVFRAATDKSVASMAEMVAKELAR
jgi:hypothetical protein